MRRNAAITVACILAVNAVIVAFVRMPGAKGPLVVGWPLLAGWPLVALLVSASLMWGAPGKVATASGQEGADGARRLSGAARRALTHWSGPTTLAVLLALLSLPLVAISLDAFQAPPEIGVRSLGDINNHGPGCGFFEGSHCEFARLPLNDLGRWAGAAENDN